MQLIYSYVTLIFCIVSFLQKHLACLWLLGRGCDASLWQALQDHKSLSDCNGGPHNYNYHYSCMTLKKERPIPKSMEVWQLHIATVCMNIQSENPI